MVGVPLGRRSGTLVATDWATIVEMVLGRGVWEVEVGAGKIWSLSGVPGL